MNFTIVTDEDFRDTSLMAEAIQNIVDSGHYIYYINDELSEDFQSLIDPMFVKKDVIVRENETPIESAESIIVFRVKYGQPKFEIHDNTIIPFKDCYNAKIYRVG